MIIDKNIMRYVVLEEDTIITALSKINANKLGFVLTITVDGLLTGILTDGDVRRWLSSAEYIDLNVKVSAAANKEFYSLPHGSGAEVISEKLSARIRSIPLVDGHGRLVAVAFSGQADLAIGGRFIGVEHQSYIIAEIGNNHNGDLNLAYKLVDLASEAGADSAKFQMRDIESLYGEAASTKEMSQDLGAQYTLDLLRKFNMRKTELFKVFDYCLERNIEPLCTPFDLVSLAALEDYGMKGYKLASADLTNHALITAMAQTGKPLICSTGMSRESEIIESVSLLKSSGAHFALLHCNSTYPAPFKDINLRYMDRLAEIGQCPIGYSGHERGWSVPVAAVARGANIIEKHFTIDTSMEGNDHRVSLLPSEFAAMVSAIRSVEESLGLKEERKLTQGEIINREVLAKSLYATRDIKIGDVISEDHVVGRSPGQGIQPNKIGELLGKSAKRNIPKNTAFFLSDIQEDTPAPRDFKFARPWGIPVRWHDFKKMRTATNLDLLEYHLSYKDIDEDLDHWFADKMDIDFVVHAPELFKGDHILDLSSDDPDYRRQSISELQRVIDITRQLTKWHSVSDAPRIITNVGGFTTSAPLSFHSRAERYENVAKSIKQLDLSGVEIIPQTMPPFPWHFGGQSFHNLFVDPDEIAIFCQSENMRICFDISHSQLACNHFHWSMKEFIEKIGKYTTHLHIVDAKGIDGEGLQIGEGDIDFAFIGELLDNTCPRASFVPEIWQGHKDNGAGFWRALTELERLFSAGSSNVEPTLPSDKEV